MKFYFLCFGAEFLVLILKSLDFIVFIISDYIIMTSIDCMNFRKFEVKSVRGPKLAPTNSLRTSLIDKEFLSVYLPKLKSEVETMIKELSNPVHSTEASDPDHLSPVQIDHLRQELIA